MKKGQSPKKAWVGIKRAVHGQRRLQAGQKIGHFTIVSEAGGTGALSWAWLVRCECGSEKVRRENALIYSGAVSCGCVAKLNLGASRLAKRQDLVGKRFGWLTVTEVFADPSSASRTFHFRAVCKCGSGGIKTGELSDLTSGQVSTCCYPRSFTAAAERLRLDVLAQIRDGATHYRARHRLVAALVADGLVDGESLGVTPAGCDALARDALPRFMARHFLGSRAGKVGSVVRGQQHAGEAL